MNARSALRVLAVLLPLLFAGVLLLTGWPGGHAQANGSAATDLESGDFSALSMDDQNPSGVAVFAPSAPVFGPLLHNERTLYLPLVMRK